MPFKELPHTSDLYLEVSGNSLENLFEEAAKAMFSELGTGKGSEEFSVEAEAPEREELLVKWLENLLVEHEVSGNIFNKFMVKIEGNRLYGKAFGGPGEVSENIKGVTFFGLKIWEEKGKYRARILFDI